MVRSPNTIEERHGVTRQEFEQDITKADRPVVLRGLVADWPAVCAAKEGTAAIAAYLRAFYNAAPVTIMAGPAAIEGRLFYRPDYRALNFLTFEENFLTSLERLLSHAADPNPPALYMGAASVANFLPGFTRDNRTDLLDANIVPNLWMGNRIVVGAHNDLPDNIACVVAGRRRFRLFPPDQIANLYVGPLEFNPAGRPVSFVSVTEPDLEMHPRFADALAASMETELDPGDALYIPSFWWHSVEALEPFNILVNYWWSVTSKDAALGEACMIHGLATIADLPERQRRAWRAYFDQYVFKTNGEPVEHIPQHARGWLGERTPDLLDAQKNLVRQSLNK